MFSSSHCHALDSALASPRKPSCKGQVSHSTHLPAIANTGAHRPVQPRSPHPSAAPFHITAQKGGLTHPGSHNYHGLETGFKSRQSTLFLTPHTVLLLPPDTQSYPKTALCMPVPPAPSTTQAPSQGTAKVPGDPVKEGLWRKKERSRDRVHGVGRSVCVCTNMYRRMHVHTHTLTASYLIWLQFPSRAGEPCGE